MRPVQGGTGAQKESGVSSTVTTSGLLELHWETQLDGTVTYQLYEVESTGQRALISVAAQGPFDTALEIAQWAWRAIARRVPPAWPEG